MDLAYHKLGCLYFDGKGVEVNYLKAKELF